MRGRGRRHRRVVNWVRVSAPAPAVDGEPSGDKDGGGGEDFQAAEDRSVQMVAVGESVAFPRGGARDGDEHGVGEGRGKFAAVDVDGELAETGQFAAEHGWFVAATQLIARLAR